MAQNRKYADIYALRGLFLGAVPIFLIVVGFLLFSFKSIIIGIIWSILVIYFVKFGKKKK